MPPKKTVCRKKKFRIWTQDYNPFILGGDVHAPMSCEVEVEEPVKLGKGITGYLIKCPDGTTVVAESETGGIVGDTLDQVMQDIKTASPKVIRDQIKEAAHRMRNANHISEDRFWEKLGRIVGGGKRRQLLQVVR